MKLFKLLFFIVFIATASSVFGQGDDFGAYPVIDKIQYQLNSNNQCTVWYSTAYGISGDVVIPSTITYQGSTYQVVAICQEAFSGTPLTSVTIPASVSDIGSYAFEGCSSITSITINSTTVYIHGFAFAYCTSLKDVTVSQATPQVIDGSMFYSSNTSNAELHVPCGSKELYQAADWWKDFGTITDDCGEFDSFINISTSSLSFTGSGEQQTFTINSNADWEISSDADWLTVSPTSGSPAGFLGSLDTVTVTVAANPTTAQRTAKIIVNGVGGEHTINVTQAAGTSSLSVSPASLSFAASGGQQTFSITSNTNWTILSTDSSWVKISPASGSNNGTVMVTIAENTATTQRTATITVSDTSGIAKQTISVTQDAAGSPCGQTWSLSPTMTAVLDCDGVLTISTTKAAGEAMPDYDWNTAPWYAVFSDVHSLDIKDKVTTIGNYAFFDCNSLTSVNIPNSVISIGKQSFSYCSSLTSVNIPNSVTSTGTFIFSGCSSLTSVNIPNSITSIADGIFEGCSGLTSIIIPNSVISIGGNAFEGCSGLTSMIIPNSVTSIGDYVFAGCTALIDVTVDWASPLSVPVSIFQDVNTSAATLHVPAGTKGLYQAANVWKDFGTIVEKASNYTLSVSPTSLNFATAGGQQTFSITSNTNWTSTSSNSWLTVSPSSGSNNGTVTVTAAVNTATSQRTATITVSGTGVTAQTITVTQDAAPIIPALSVSPASLNFAASGEQQTFAITSNTDWTATSSDLWLTVSPSSGSNNGTVTVTVAVNTATSQRTATITVSGTGVTAQTITITQDAAPIIPALSISPASLNFAASGEQQTFAITSNTDWTVTSSDSWLAISPSSGSNDGMITVTAAANSDSIQRTAIITIIGTGVATQTINVTQDAADIPSVIPDETQPVGTDGKGTIALDLSIPSSATLTGSFEIQFPAGMALDSTLTVLSAALSGNFYLAFSYEGNNTWLIEIKSNALKSSTASDYTNIMTIAYTVNDSVSKGVYDATIKNLDFIQDNGTSIKEDLLTVPINVERVATSIESISNASFYAYIINNMLKIESSQAETITVYSAAGVQIYSAKKDVGLIDIPVSSLPGSVYIIKGSVSGTIKVVK